MPFTTLSNAPPPPADEIGLERYAADLPEPLVVAILDRDAERDARTTAMLVYGFLYDHPASTARIEVPSGFVTDFASIPAAAQLVFSPFGRHAKAAVLHDWIYSVGEPGLKAFADHVFRDAMAELGVDKAKRDIMFEAVHLFGGSGYNHAARDWPTSWADYTTGDPASPPKAREEYFKAKWPKPPTKAYLDSL